MMMMATTTDTQQTAVKLCHSYLVILFASPRTVAPTLVLTLNGHTYTLRGKITLPKFQPRLFGFFHLNVSLAMLFTLQLAQ